MNKQEIVTVLSELHKISGFRISLHASDYREIAAYPERALPFCERVNRAREEHKLCTECDRVACLEAERRHGTYIYKCRYGLTEAVSPLYSFGVLTGYLMMGQIASSEEERESAIGRLRRILGAKADPDIKTDSIPTVRSDMISSYVRIMTICAEYLTLSNATEATLPPREEIAKRFIEENLHRKLSLNEIAAHVGCSRSTLLSDFKTRYGRTVNEYLVEARLERSVRLLLEGRLTVGEIALDVGFGDQSYFSKVFTARYGRTPSSYRHSVHAEEASGTKEVKN